MKHYRYLIVGGGLAGDAAARGILELDVAASIGMISKESDPPYARPSLSKGLWKGRPIGKIWRNTRDLGVELYLERTVTDLDPTEKYLRDNAGGEYTYDKLLLATGGSPIRLPFGDDNIIYYRDFQDYHRLRAWTER
ncbi:MAG TPA: FAD-dependent oxidoreductase, partial [Anaerolineales bacterium]|nr:FAD-dependent oxidoreductase [Anaerolineales bacterium]